MTTYLMRGLIALSLVYYLWLVLDLVLHPWALAVDATGARTTRILGALVGTGVIVLGAVLMRRVGRNNAGPLLVLWGVGSTTIITREDLGSPLLTALAHLFFELYWNGVAPAALLVLVVCFPTGRVYARWVAGWVRLEVILVISNVVFGVMAQNPNGSVRVISGWADLPINPFFVPALAPYAALITGTINGIVSLLGIGGAIGLLIVRYRAAPSRERQQIKWFV